MKNLRFFPFLAFAVLLSCQKPSESTEDIVYDYPMTRQVDTVDTYFGQEVKDPYRWLEDDMSEETASWVEAENAITFSYLNSIPFRDRIRERLEEVYNYERVYATFKRGEYYYFYRTDRLQNQNVHY